MRRFSFLTLVVLFSLWSIFLAEDGEYFSEPSGLTLILSLVILALVTIGGTMGGSLTYDWDSTSRPRPTIRCGTRASKTSSTRTTQRQTTARPLRSERRRFVTG